MAHVAQELAGLPKLVQRRILYKRHHHHQHVWFETMGALRSPYYDFFRRKEAFLKKSPAISKKIPWSLYQGIFYK